MLDFILVGLSAVGLVAFFITVIEKMYE